MKQIPLQWLKKHKDLEEFPLAGTGEIRDLDARLRDHAAKISALFRYAENFCAKKEAAGFGTRWPTFRQCASRMKCTYDELEQLVEDYQGDGYMGVGVAFRVGGMGGGVFSIETRGEYVVEAYH